jgi:hypothetical protein
MAFFWMIGCAFSFKIGFPKKDGECEKLMTNIELIRDLSQ